LRFAAYKARTNLSSPWREVEEIKRVSILPVFNLVKTADNVSRLMEDERVRQAGEQLLKALAEELKGAPRAVAEQRLSLVFSDLWNRSEQDIFRNLPAQVGGRGEGPGRKPD